MMVVRRAFSIIGELALEAFVSGLFGAAGEAVVTEGVKAAKKARKRRKKEPARQA